MQQNNEGNGDCLFIAMAQAFSMHLHPHEVRLCICVEMAEHPDQYEPFVSREYENPHFQVSDFSGYTHRMEKPGVHGGNPEISAFCELFNCAVMLYHETLHTFTMFHAEYSGKETIFLSYVKRGEFRHYTSLFPVDPSIHRKNGYNVKEKMLLEDVSEQRIHDILIENGLQKLFIRIPEINTLTCVFGTKSDFEKTKKLLVLALIPDSGSMEWATQYIQQGIDMGYDVLVLNPNLCYRINKDGERIYLNSSPEIHWPNAVWQQLIDPYFDAINSFDIIAFDRSGIAALEMMANHQEQFEEKCNKLFFVDSIHEVGHEPKQCEDFLRDHAIQFKASSDVPKGSELLHQYKSIIPCLSAGECKHDSIPHAVFNLIFTDSEENPQKTNPLSKAEVGAGAADWTKIESPFLSEMLRYSPRKVILQRHNIQLENQRVGMEQVIVDAKKNLKKVS